MTTINETKALQLAQRVFEHFTRDSLAIAREIIALESEFGLQDPQEEPSMDVQPPIVDSIGLNSNDDLSAIGLEDPCQPVKHMDDELVCTKVDDLPF